MNSALQSVVSRSRKSSNIEEEIKKIINQYPVTTISDLISMSHYLYSALNKKLNRSESAFITPDVESYSINIKVISFRPVAFIALDKTISFSINGIIRKGYTLKEIILARKVQYNRHALQSLEAWMRREKLKSINHLYSQEVYDRAMSEWLYIPRISDDERYSQLKNYVTMLGISQELHISYMAVLRYLNVFGMARKRSSRASLPISVIEAFRFLKPYIRPRTKIKEEIVQMAKKIALGEITYEQATQTLEGVQK